MQCSETRTARQALRRSTDAAPSMFPAGGQDVAKCVIVNGSAWWTDRRVGSHGLHKLSTLASWNAGFWGKVEGLHLVADPQRLGDPKLCLPVIPKSLASWNADFWGEVEMDNSKNTDSCTTSRRSEDQQQHCQWERPERGVPVRSGLTQFFAEPCLYHINIDESFYFQRI
ncbi:BQ5605_C011g06314 [Microbotryum silenes-dioicae]|uniref:BQ5605_C011g06314 protein n=1 Tax=Microbotryum silenes-dioicae TaxID=796604 RepID=A0A2X0NKY9_9BASI|nr:BQ5605_C011g06314 [Microbotryum silenes-dioicae]